MIQDKDGYYYTRQKPNWGISFTPHREDAEEYDSQEAANKVANERLSGWGVKVTKSNVGGISLRQNIISTASQGASAG